jgi:hypothetical protein
MRRKLASFLIEFFSSKSALIQRAEDGSPPNDKPCNYAGKSPKINPHTLVWLIKIYSTDISAQKDANMLSICLIGFTYSPIHQSRHNFVFFTNYCTGGGGTLKETGVRALSEKWNIPLMFSHQICIDSLYRRMAYLEALGEVKFQC